MPKRWSDKEEARRAKQRADARAARAQQDERNAAAIADSAAARDAHEAFTALSPDEQRAELQRRHAENRAAQQQRNEETKAAAGPPENKMLPADQAAPENKAAGLDGIAFASPQAREAAEAFGLTADSFRRRRKGSDKGFTLADVERVADATGAGEEE